MPFYKVCVYTSVSQKDRWSWVKFKDFFFFRKTSSEYQFFAIEFRIIYRIVIKKTKRKKLVYETDFQIILTSFWGYKDEWCLLFIWEK